MRIRQQERQWLWRLLALTTQGLVFGTTLMGVANSSHALPLGSGQECEVGCTPDVACNAQCYDPTMDSVRYINSVKDPQGSTTCNQYLFQTHYYGNVEPFNVSEWIDHVGATMCAGDIPVAVYSIDYLDLAGSSMLIHAYVPPPPEYAKDPNGKDVRELPDDSNPQSAPPLSLPAAAAVDRSFHFFRQLNSDFAITADRSQPNPEWGPGVFRCGLRLDARLDAMASAAWSASNTMNQQLDWSASNTPNQQLVCIDATRRRILQGCSEGGGTIAFSNGTTVSNYSGPTGCNVDAALPQATYCTSEDALRSSTFGGAAADASAVAQTEGAFNAYVYLRIAGSADIPIVGAWGGFSAGASAGANTSYQAAGPSGSTAASAGSGAGIYVRYMDGWVPKTLSWVAGNGGGSATQKLSYGDVFGKGISFAAPNLTLSSQSWADLGSFGLPDWQHHLRLGALLGVLQLFNVPFHVPPDLTGLDEYTLHNLNIGNLGIALQALGVSVTIPSPMPSFDLGKVGGFAGALQALQVSMSLPANVLDIDGLSLTELPTLGGELGQLGKLGALRLRLKLKGHFGGWAMDGLGRARPLVRDSQLPVKDMPLTSFSPGLTFPFALGPIPAYVTFGMSLAVGLGVQYGLSSGGDAMINGGHIAVVPRASASVYGEVGIGVDDLACIGGGIRSTLVELSYSRRIGASFDGRRVRLSSQGSLAANAGSGEIYSFAELFGGRLWEDTLYSWGGFSLATQNFAAEPVQALPGMAADSAPLLAALPASIPPPTWTWGNYPIEPPPNLVAPSNLTATVLSSTHVVLVWADNSVGEDGTQVERARHGLYTNPTPVMPIGVYSPYGYLHASQRATLDASVQRFCADKGFDGAASYDTMGPTGAAYSWWTGTSWSTTGNGGVFLVQNLDCTTNWAVVGTTQNINAPTWADNSLAAASRYAYRVRSYRNATMTGWSNVAIAVTP
jgi:hypothetical protein